jgi:hypothetical protein
MTLDDYKIEGLSELEQVFAMIEAEYRDKGARCRRTRLKSCMPSAGGRVPPLCQRRCKCGSPCRITVNLYQLIICSHRRFGQLAGPVCPTQKIAVEELSSPEAAPIIRTLKWLEAIPAAIMESIIVDQLMVSIVENTRPRY